MNTTTDSLLTGMHETVIVPYNINSINGSLFYLPSSTSVTTTELFAKYLLANITEGGPSGVKVQISTSRRPFGGRRRLPESSDETLQLVSKQVADKVSFIFVMILIPCFSVFGSVGNVLSLRVLVHHHMRNATNMVLAALSASDLLFLLHALYFSCLRLYSQRNPVAGEQVRSMTFPVLGPYGSVVTARITTGLTTMLSMERLVAVYFPMKAKVICGKVMTMTCIVMIYLLTALLFIPNALKYHGYYTTINNQTTYIMGRTELGKNDLFYLIYGNILNVLFRFIPLLILIQVNILIALAIRKTWSFRKTMSNGASASYEQNRITLMLLMVSLVFLICILPGAIHSIMDQVYKQYSSHGHQSNIYDVVRNVTYFLETVNSSVNFVIYMAFSTKFCRTYKQIFCCSQHRNEPQNSVKSIIRFSFRPHNGSRTSMTSYRELHFLNQLGKMKLPVTKNGELNKPVYKNGSVTNASGVVEEGGKILYRSKYSINESYSGHSQSHSGHSQSGHSQSHSGHSQSHSGHSQSHSGHSQSHSGHSQSYSGHTQSHSGHSQSHNSQGKGERCNEHNINSIQISISNHNLEPSAAEKYS